MRILNRLYAFVGVGVVVLGSLHMVATLRLSASAPAYRLWFFGSGMAMALVGALNLLHRAYGHSASGLRISTAIAYAVLLCFAIVAGWLTSSSMSERIAIVALVGTALVLSFAPAAWNIRVPSERA